MAAQQRREIGSTFSIKVNHYDWPCYSCKSTTKYTRYYVKRMTNIEPNTTLQDRNPKENFGAHHKGVPSDAMTPEVLLCVYSPKTWLCVCVRVYICVLLFRKQFDIMFKFCCINFSWIDYFKGLSKYWKLFRFIAVVFVSLENLSGPICAVFDPTSVLCCSQQGAGGLVPERLEGCK